MNIVLAVRFSIYQIDSTSEGFLGIGLLEKGWDIRAYVCNIILLFGWPSLSSTSKSTIYTLTGGKMNR